MGIASIMRCAMVGTGLALAFASFWFHAAKKMMPDLAAAWCLVGIVIGAVGAVPALSMWLEHISGWTGAALFFVGGTSLWAAFRICLTLSRLATQNQELAMQVSLLLHAQQRTEEGGGNTAEERADDEESIICH